MSNRHISNFIYRKYNRNLHVHNRIFFIVGRVIQIYMCLKNDFIYLFFYQHKLPPKDWMYIVYVTLIIVWAHDMQNMKVSKVSICIHNYV